MNVSGRVSVFGNVHGREVDDTSIDSGGMCYISPYTSIDSEHEWTCVCV